MNLKLNVYDSTGKNIAKTCTAETFDIMFGTVNTLMNLLKIEQLDNQVELIKTICDAWDELTNILNNVFPNMTDEDWNHVKVKELVPIIVGIVKYTISETMSIPSDSKN